MTFNVRTIKRAGLLSALFLIAFVVAACTPVRLEATWGSLSTTGDPTSLVFAYYDRVVKIDPVTGRPAQLLDDSGSVRLDDAGNPRIWEVRAPGNNAQVHFYTAPVELDPNTLLIASQTGHLYEVDNRTARIDDPVGISIPGAVVANPVFDQGTLYVPYSAGDMQALMGSQFQPAWTLDTEHGIYGQPVLADGVLYIGSLDHKLYAVNAETGDVLWSVDLNGAITAAPALHNGALYVGSFARKLYKVSLDGEIVASVDAGNWVWGTPAVDGDMIYFGDVSGNLYAVRDTGSALEVQWTRAVATNAIVATPLVAGDVLVVGSRDRHVYWIDRATGAEIQKRETKGEVLGNMLLLEPSDTLSIGEPIVIISTLANEELVVAFTLDNGERLWAYQR